MLTKVLILTRFDPSTTSMGCIILTYGLSAGLRDDAGSTDQPDERA